MFLNDENTKIFQSGLIIMGNLPKWKMKDFQSDEKCEGFSKWFYCNGQPAQEEKAKIFQNGKNCEDFFKVVKKVNDFSKWSYCNGQSARRKM
jgi:hypothetical protein